MTGALHPEFARALIDPKTLMSIRNLELRARVVVEGFWNGLHRSPYHGFSVEFTEYRQYTPGDDPRYLDWRLFARSDRYYIKKFEDEIHALDPLLDRVVPMFERTISGEDFSRQEPGCRGIVRR